MLKLFAIDFGWAGGAAVLAESKEKAFELFKEQVGYGCDEDVTLEEIQEIEPGTVFQALGDI